MGVERAGQPGQEAGAGRHAEKISPGAFKETPRTKDLRSVQLEEFGSGQSEDWPLYVVPIANAERPILGEKEGQDAFAKIREG